MRFKMKKLLMSLCLVGLVTSCSSRKLKKEYTVVDSSHTEVPEWIVEYEEYIEDMDTKKNRFYKFETDPKNNRQIACKIAKAEAASHVAGEIQTKIKDVLTTSKEGDASELGGKLDEYVSNTLTMDIESALSGLKIIKTYWEKRAYAKDLGAIKDYRAFSCSVLLKISKKSIKNAIAKSNQKILKMTPNNAKENVQKRLMEVVQ
jgi:hypothetical protein